MKVSLRADTIFRYLNLCCDDIQNPRYVHHILGNQQASNSGWQIFHHDAKMKRGDIVKALKLRSGHIFTFMMGKVVKNISTQQQHKTSYFFKNTKSRRVKW